MNTEPTRLGRTQEILGVYVERGPIDYSKNEN